MKIVEEINKLNDSDLINIVHAEYLKDYCLKINFNDATEKVIDFEPFLLKSYHPEIKKYLNKKLFQTFSIIDGNLNWNDYDLIFPLEDLYTGKI